ncbi:MAG TPA: glycoside hydrolase family 3 C-terminal domain-containing protein [Parafilimonas sp.]|nr:glycoside hydrolase family 3 C-terminal domain-containing protein [Parafilimonas sp.]
MKKNVLVFLFFIVSFCVNKLAAQNTPQLGKNSVEEVVAAMTLDEKAKLVVGNGFNMPGAGGPTIGQTKDKVPGASGTTFAIPRLGIPSIVVADGPAGLRIDPIRNSDSSKTYYATAWPVATLLASTWDTGLVKKVGAAFGSEVHNYGVDIILGPGLNIHRNPLGGRNFEYYSEDPLIAGSMTAAIVNGIESNGVGTSIKHYAANNQETNRNTVNTIVSERALREIYLKGFEIAVKRSNPWTVMSSYNLINDTLASESYGLLTTVLRKDWGYKGFVMSDWFGGRNPVEQMKAGNDLLMPGTKQQSQRIIDAVNHDSLDVKILDENCERILNIVLQSPSFKNYKFSDKPDLKKDAAVSREAATEGMVLLKNNDNALPFKSIKTVALFGNNGYDLIAGGTGSGDVNKAYKISLFQGLGNAGYTVDAAMQTTYQDYLTDYNAKHPKKNFFQEFMNPTPPAPEYAIDNSVIAAKAASADVAVITIGRNAGEGKDRKVENDFNLSDAEQALIQNVTDAFHAKNKKVIVVLNIGGVIEVASWRDKVDGILLAWQPGLEGGNAITDILSGKVNPSGRLATTFPVKYEYVPSAKNFPGKEFPDQATTGGFGMKLVPGEVTYEEGVYVGYRYYNTFHVKPAYEFGYGLSYGNFTFGNLKLTSASFDNNITASITITNQGKMPGKEVVQLYINAPANNLDKPAQELKAFAKTKLLKPGETQTLKFTLTAADLASFYTDKASWIADAGNYEVRAGASSSDIRLKATFNLPNDLVVEKVNKTLAPKAGINEIKLASKDTGYIEDLNSFSAIGQ